jgi:GT2 family glycosyltransferase
MKLSVLIATYNRDMLLRKALAALVDRSNMKADEIVIVNGGDDRADSVVREFQARTETAIRLIRTVNKNLACSRNIGLRACSGDIIAMTDDDGEVGSEWVAQMKEQHARHPEAGAVGGAVLGSSSHNNFLSRICDIVTFSSPSSPCYVRTLPGVNISYKREVVEAVGLQDEALFRGEDVDYNWRVKQLGYEIFYHPEIVVIHHHRPTLSGFLRQHHHYGRAYVIVRRKWPAMYCVYPHRIRTFRDILKLGYFFAAIVVEPLRFCSKLERWFDKGKAFPLLVVCQCAWRGGMLLQFWKTHGERRGKC